MKPVQLFFIVGGGVFLLAALFFRETSFAGADEMALTFGLIGFFWAAPQLLILGVKQWSAHRASRG